MRFLFIIMILKISLCCCDSTYSNNTFTSKMIRVGGEQFNNKQENDLTNKNLSSECSTVKGNTLTSKKEINNTIKKTNKKNIKNPKQAKKNSKRKRKTKVTGSKENKAKTIKKARKKLSDKSKSDESKSKSEDSEEPKYQLREGESLLDMSALAKIKSFEFLDQDSHVPSRIKVKTVTKDNPLLNWNCSSLSLEEEKHISTGYLDKRISHVITHAENFPDGGTQLLDDMRQYYCYLKHVNQLVVDHVRRGKVLMKKLVEEDPEFIQIGFDTDELTEHFSWVAEESEAFEQIMDGICYQWKCLAARLKHK